jgi:hypothetical protein
MTIQEYTIKKLEKFNFNIEDSLVRNLESSILKVADKQGLTFVGFGYESISGNSTEIIEWWLPVKLEEAYSEITETGRSNAADKGFYVHIVNNDINLNRIEEEIQRFSSIEGEICVSDFGDNYHNPRKSTLGIVLEGKPTASFDYDCWSVVNEQTGSRVATYRGNPSRNEHWIIPAKSKIVALIVSENIYPYVAKAKVSIWDVTATYIQD